MAVALAVFISVLIAASVLAPSPPRSRPSWVAACGLIGLGAPLAALSGEAGRSVLHVSIAAAVALLAVATWLARGIDAGAGPDDVPPPSPEPPEPPAPWDWDEFERARGDWSRPRSHA